ncbi:MAG: hypothetical protein PF904_19800 [Kiritimatiellae bacterium]|jgi:Arc/MetJ-type ribon-helix-helix transcriptional regulator|nr:hypothetical protein [Kiritimatiellia bacterium]
MPGQRKEGKKRIAVWLTEEERQMLDVLIEQGAVKDMSDFVKKSILSAAKREGVKQE